MKRLFRVFSCWFLVGCLLLAPGGVPAQGTADNVKAAFVMGPPAGSVNKFYTGNRTPLLKHSYEKLPVMAFRPGGWLKRQLELQRDGLTGHLGEISIWLSKKDNAWLNKDGVGKYGWEELPYWLKGYANIGYMLRDEKIIG